MIRNDFVTGGFPVNKRNPVLCFADDGKVYVAYDRYELKTIMNHLQGESKKILKCLGVWPGKTNTDCFPMDPQYYSELYPPVEHRDIDNASSIQLYYSGGAIDKTVYFMDSTEATGIMSRDETLFNYVLKVGLPHTTVYEGSQ